LNDNHFVKTVSAADVEDFIDRFMHADALPCDSDDNFVATKSGLSSADEALWRLKTLQLINDTKESIERVKRMDAFANPAARTGWGEDNLINATEYPMTRLTQDWQLLTSLYRTSWIVQRVCNVIPEDALADLMIEVPGISTEGLHKLEEEVRSTHLRDSLLEALRWGRLYGGAAAIIMISGQEEDLSLPIDINNIMPGSFRGLYVVDRWSGIYPSLTLVDNERDPDFGLPDYYEVRDETSGGTYRVHHSRVLRFCGTKMPYWEEVAEQYWGTSAIEALYDELIKRDNVAHNIANLTFKANLSVLQVENLDQMFATSSSVHQRRMYAMLSAINTMENSLGIRLVNKGDDIQQLQYSFSGLPEVMDSAMMDMAGATSIPVTRLFGRSPAGMNSTGESDEKMYRQTLEQERAVHITPVLERLIPIVCHSALGCFPAGANFKYPSLIEIAPQEKASIIDQQIQPLERLFQSNLLSGDKDLEALRNAQTSLDITPVITDDDIARVKGKYYNDLQNNADPYGGAMQTANEAGIESGAEQVDENGNPIEQPQVDENGNPIEQQQEATPEQQAAAVKQLKPTYEAITKSVSPKISQDVIVQNAFSEGLSPKDLKRRLIEQRKSLEQEKRLKKAYRQVLKSEPAEVSQDLVSEIAAMNQIDPEEFAQSMMSQQQAANGDIPDQQQQPQQEQPQEQQRQDSLRRRKLRRMRRR
jgi:phage-related protein (TIGR01555 family)